MLISFIMENWRKILWGGFIVSFILVYLYHVDKIKNLKLALDQKQEQIQLQKQYIQSQKVKYTILESQLIINESSLNDYILLTQKYKRDLTDAKLQIQKIANQLDNSNVITYEWLRYATGSPTMSTISSAASSSDGKISPSQSIQPSAAAWGIQEFVNECQLLAVQHDLLIENIYKTAENYNSKLSNINNNVVK